MRYGNPSTESACVERCVEQGCERVLCSFRSIRNTPQQRRQPSTTSCSTALMKMRDMPPCAPCRPITTTGLHRGAGQTRIERHLAKLEFRAGESSVASYHGIPQPYFEEGRSLSLPLP
jgi:protoheme ferro-lyase